MQGGIWVTAGLPNSELKGYFQARNGVIAFNTIVDSAGPCLQLDAGLGTARRTLRPENITVATNLFCPGPGGTVLKGTEGARWTWLGNLAAGARVDRAGIRTTELKLTRDANGLLRPVEESLAVAGINPNLSAAAARRLTPGNVGPSWMDRSASPAKR
jgi:hypothetical protein